MKKLFNLILWIISVILIIGSIGGFISGDILFALIVLVIGVFFLPPVLKKLFKKKGKDQSDEKYIEVTTKPIGFKKGKSNKTSGKFDVIGYHHLSEEVKRIVWKELKVGDTLDLLADPSNKYDKEAVKVMFNGVQIGWIPKSYRRKSMIFQALINNENIKTTCISNDRRGHSKRTPNPKAKGGYDYEYIGMAQFVEAKYKIEK